MMPRRLRATRNVHKIAVFRRARVYSRARACAARARSDVDIARAAHTRFAARAAWRDDDMMILMMMRFHIHDDC